MRAPSRPQVLRRRSRRPDRGAGAGGGAGLPGGRRPRAGAGPGARTWAACTPPTGSPPTSCSPPRGSARSAGDELGGAALHRRRRRADRPGGPLARLRPPRRDARHAATPTAPAAREPGAAGGDQRLPPRRRAARCGRRSCSTWPTRWRMRGRGRDMIPALRLAQELDPRDDAEAALDRAHRALRLPHRRDRGRERRAPAPRICASLQRAAGAGRASTTAPTSSCPTDALTGRGSRAASSASTGSSMASATASPSAQGLPAASGEALAKHGRR